MTNSDDRLDQALRGLRETVSEDEQLPADLVARVRKTIHDRQNGEAVGSIRRCRYGSSHSVGQTSCRSR